MSSKIPVGISACLMGEKVRFDGGHKRLTFAMDDMVSFVAFTAICPEMAIGLPAPHPALKLVKNPNDHIALRISKETSPVDYTASMEAFARQRVRQLADLCGYIVCAKSPSCGMARVRVYEAQGVQKTGVGLYTRILQEQMPWLPVEEDGRLQDVQLRENFVARIFTLWEFNQLLRHPATRCNHTNVLMHAQGYFYRYLTRAQRSELTGLIDSYRQGLQSLLAPITLLKHYMAEYPNAWLAQQRYFEPYPEALRLRYGH
ncbi:ybgA [Candidatus Sodalis pierantonius str. SOPE]|uniref:YbgA n=1 Tax=Candidatus Sodalis pierantonii str. SOPE TaxID=2342 RepID=W0HLX6_9GAMM|nr:DUF523 and DUF1722 domain-containing protein [Candidatus Sodalis pierantonius]AHF73195.1 ybgA [Candidatus Sodalis pierantonius str. SOPE]